MLDGLGRPLLGRPTPAQPLGEQESDPVSAPLAAKVGLNLPPREMTATARWELPDEDDEPDDPDPVPTARHRRAF